MKLYMKQTIKEYLTEHPEAKHVLIKFHHGLGDALMFHAGPLQALRRAFPDVTFSVHTHCGQEELFGVVNENESDYEAAFELNFPCAEWDAGSISKPEKCAMVETGVPFDTEEYGEICPKTYNPFVGLHFHSTCIEGLRCREETAKEIWGQLEAEGMIPIDTHMAHCHDNRGKAPDWARRNMDGIKATPHRLMGVMASLCGFIGTPSGNFFAALSQLPPDRVMYLYTNFKAEKLTKLPVWQLDVRNGYDKLALNKFIEHLKGKK